MADKHPYANANGALIQLLDQLKKSFPSAVDADLLKKLGIAPKNESYVINVIRFLGLIDEEGKRIEKAHKIFTIHETQDFQKAFAGLVESAYSGLFDIHKEGAWTQPDGKLISFFRQADQSSELVGGRQASTFKTLASYVGRSKDPIPSAKPKAVKQPSSAAATRSSKSADSKIGLSVSPKSRESDNRMSLTVRIEVNLPAGGDKDTYDQIFKSIRENLMNG